MKFSLLLNSQIGPTADAVKLAVQAEKQGLECIWYCQDLFQRDVWVFLTATATHTKHIDLGTCIINPHTVNPAELAMHAATLDEYSNGRLRLGISVGALEFLKWVGVNVHHPLSAMRESIDLIRRLMRGERVEHEGKVFKGWTRDAYMRFNLLRSNIPIYLGAQKKHLLKNPILVFSPKQVYNNSTGEEQYEKDYHTSDILPAYFSNVMHISAGYGIGKKRADKQ